MVTAMWPSGDGVARYQGPERRARERIPPVLEVGSPSRRLWVRGVWIAIAVGLCAVALSALSSRGLVGMPLAYASLNLGWAIGTLVASIGLYFRWRLSGEAPIGLLAAALAVSSVPLLILWVTHPAGDLQGILRSQRPLLQLAVVLPSAWILQRSVRAQQVDSALQPAAIVAAYGGVASALLVGLSLGGADGLVPDLGPVADSVTDLLTAVVFLAFAYAFARCTRAVTRGVALRLSAAFLALALASLTNVMAREWWAPLWVLSGFVSVVAALLLCVLAVSLLRAAIDFNRARLEALSKQATTAEQTALRDQERLHELRATVSGIRSASVTLSRYPDRIAPDQSRLLQEMMGEELARLERLLEDDAAKPPLEPICVDDVLRPLVLRHRQQGMCIGWRPCGLSAMMRPDEVAEIVNILLTNAHRHAPGSPVQVDVEAPDPHTLRLAVADEGPGVPEEHRARIFDRGVRSEDSPGQGLGLHIARGLAVSQGGVLTMEGRPDSRGAQFVLSLPRPAPSPRPDTTGTATSVGGST